MLVINHNEVCSYRKIIIMKKNSGVICKSVLFFLYYSIYLFIIIIH